MKENSVIRGRLAQVSLECVLRLVPASKLVATAYRGQERTATEYYLPGALGGPARSRGNTEKGVAARYPFFAIRYSLYCVGTGRGDFTGRQLRARIPFSLPRSATAIGPLGGSA